MIDDIQPPWTGRLEPKVAPREIQTTSCEGGSTTGASNENSNVEMKSQVTAPENSQDTSAASIRSELAAMKLSELKQRARRLNIDQQLLDDADDADNIKAAVIDLLLEYGFANSLERVDQMLVDFAEALRSVSLASGWHAMAIPALEKAAGLQPSSAIASAAMHAKEAQIKEEKLQSLRAELTPLRLSALQKKAIAAGISEDAIEAALDEDDAKQGVIELLISTSLEHNTTSRTNDLGRSVDVATHKPTIEAGSDTTIVHADLYMDQNKREKTHGSISIQAKIETRDSPAQELTNNEPFRSTTSPTLEVTELVDIELINGQGFGLEIDDSAHVVNVKEGSVAAEAQVPVPSKICSVNGMPVNSKDNLLALLQSLRKHPNLTFTFRASHAAMADRKTKTARLSQLDAGSDSEENFESIGELIAPVPAPTPAPLRTRSGTKLPGNMPPIPWEAQSQNIDVPERRPTESPQDIFKEAVQLMKSAAATDKARQTLEEGSSEWISETEKSLDLYYNALDGVQSVLNCGQYDNRVLQTVMHKAEQLNARVDVLEEQKSSWATPEATATRVDGDINVLVSGYLLKSSSKHAVLSKGKWSTRYMVILGGAQPRLLYFKNEQTCNKELQRSRETGELKCTGDMDLTAAIAEFNGESTPQFDPIVAIRTPQRSLYVSMVTKMGREDADRWIAVITAAVREQFCLVHQCCGDICTKIDNSLIPGRLGCTGIIEVELAAWAEASRDFTRLFVAASDDILVMSAAGPGQLADSFANVQCTISTGGNVNSDVTSQIVAEFEKSVLQALNFAEISADRAQLTQLLEHVVGHMTITPAMQVLLDHDVQPAMYQNKFVLLVGSGQVRVCTYGFIGEPARGDRPDNKSTPYVLRLLSPNLLTQQATGAHRVHYTVGIAAASMINQLLQQDREILAAAVNSGEFSTLSHSTSMSKFDQQERQYTASRKTDGEVQPSLQGLEPKHDMGSLDSIDTDSEFASPIVSSQAQFPSDILLCGYLLKSSSKHAVLSKGKWSTRYMVILGGAQPRLLYFKNEQTCNKELQRSRETGELKCTGDMDLTAAIAEFNGESTPQFDPIVAIRTPQRSLYVSMVTKMGREDADRWIAVINGISSIYSPTEHNFGSTQQVSSVGGTQHPDMNSEALSGRPEKPPYVPQLELTLKDKNVPNMIKSTTTSPGASNNPALGSPRWDREDSSPNTQDAKSAAGAMGNQTLGIAPPRSESDSDSEEEAHLMRLRAVAESSKTLAKPPNVAPVNQFAATSFSTEPTRLSLLSAMEDEDV